MLEFYPQIKWVHVYAAVASALVFGLRWGLVGAGLAGAARRAAMRWLAWTVDATLLTAALMLVAVLPDGFFANGWLLAKLAFVATYAILSGTAVRAGSRRIRVLAGVGALAAFGAAIGVARAHHPLGPLAAWLA